MCILIEYLLLTSLKITFLVTSQTEPAERRADEKDDYVCKRKREREREREREKERELIS